MSHIRTEISQMFNNPKVADLYANSYGGEDMIYTEIERYFSFNEIYEIRTIFPQGHYLSFLSKYESSQGLSEFFKKFEQRCEEIYSFYEEKKSVEYLNEMLELNKIHILKTYPKQLEIDAKLKFARDYLKKHKKAYHQTFEQSKDFFNHPSSYI